MCWRDQFFRDMRRGYARKFLDTGCRDRSQASGLLRVIWAPLASPGSKEVSGDEFRPKWPYIALI